MKRFLGIVLVVGILASATFADTYVWKGNAEDKVTGVPIAGTMNLSDASKWVFGAVFPNLPAAAPWAGIVNANQGADGLGGTLYHQYTSEARMADQYGMTLNVDTDLGDGTFVANRGGTSITPVYNVLGKWSGKNGTVNMNGHTIWADGLQMGTVARTTYRGIGGVGYAGGYTLNMDSGSKLVAIGTAQIGYGAYVDTFVNMSGNAELRVAGATKNTELGKTSATYQRVFWNLNGSDLSITLDALKMNNFTTGVVGVDALQQKIKFVMDADGASAVNINRAASTALVMGLDSRLIIELTAVPVASEIVLFNLVDPLGAVSGLNGGKFRDKWGKTIVNSSNYLYADFESTRYWFNLNYNGGTGNDVTLTLVPEPATIGLLSLGGLVLARRRRA
jgi:hypothetical protein